MQKLQLKNEPVVLSTSESPCADDTCTTIKMTNQIVPNQVQEKTFDKVNEEPKLIAKRLSYKKALSAKKKFRNDYIIAADTIVFAPFLIASIINLFPSYVLPFIAKKI